MGAAVGCGLRWLASEVDAAIADVRSLARGTYPYVLTDYGLAAALAVAADAAPVSTTVVAEPRRRYAAGDREAMYFCCLEALQNASKHAGIAAAVRITMDERDDSVRFEAHDRERGSTSTLRWPAWD
jgi:signal transduction histidine kinase